MKKKLLDILTHQSKVCVVEKNLSSNEYDVFQIQIKKGELQEIKADKGLSDYNMALKAIPKSLPIILHLSGKGILNKVVKNKPNYRSSALLNTNEDDFYFQEYATNEKVFISVIRKDILNEEILKLKASSLFVVESFFGPFLLDTNQFIPNKPNRLKLDKTTLEYSNGGLTETSKPTEDQEGFTLQYRSLSKAYAITAAFKYFEKKDNNQLNESLFSKDQRLKVLFNRAAIFVLGFFLIGLTLNYVWLNELNKEVAEKNGRLAEHQEALNEINQLKDEKKRKLKLLNTSGILNSNFISFYLDEIGASIPISISLDELEVYPIKNNIKANQQIKIDDHFISIAGKTQKSQPFNNWIQDLTAKEWVAKIEIQSYNKRRKGEYEFEIKMQLK